MYGLKTTALFLSLSAILIFAQAQDFECTFEQSPAAENHFDSHNASEWMFATWSFGTNATMFKAENGKFNNSKLDLILKKENFNGKSYTGAHYQSHKGYGYGRYEVKMKAAKGGGLVSSFFLYSDEDKKPENGSRWHEIDFEFIHNPLNGNRPTLQFNYWNHSANHSGASGNEVRVEEKEILTEGLREKYHKLTIDYTPKYIKWSVDDIVYHTVTENIPQSNTLKIMMNIWRPEDKTNGTTGDGINWAGTVNDSNLPVNASYDYVKYYPLADCNSLSINDLENKNSADIKIYPNPAEDVFFIELSKKSTAGIYNTAGKELKKLSLKKGKNKIIVSDLPCGVYFVKMKNRTLRFIKK